MAIDSALEAGSPLIIANMLPLRPYATTIMLLGPGAATLPAEEDLDAVRATAQRAAELGLKTQLLRISTPRPVQAILELLSEQRAGLLVFGPDPARIGSRRLRTRHQPRGCAKRLPASSGSARPTAPDARGPGGCARAPRFARPSGV